MEAARFAASYVSCLGWETGEVEPSGAYYPGEKVTAEVERDYASIHYMTGGSFLAPGDDAWTAAVPRGIVSPPLEDGEYVTFTWADDGTIGELRRNC